MGGNTCIYHSSSAVYILEENRTRKIGSLLLSNRTIHTKRLKGRNNRGEEREEESVEKEDTFRLLDGYSPECYISAMTCCFREQETESKGGLGGCEFHVRS